MGMRVSLFEIVTADRRCLIRPPSFDQVSDQKDDRILVPSLLHQGDCITPLPLLTLSHAQQSQQYEGEDIDDSHPHPACPD